MAQLLEQWRQDNYLLWLRERGLSSPKTASATPGPTFAATPPLEKTCVFLSDLELSDDELILVGKMAAAVGLNPDQYVVLTAESWLRGEPEVQAPSHVVLGEAAWRQVVAHDHHGTFAAAQGLWQALPVPRRGDSLATLHPRDLLREPEQKRRAWQDLQVLIQRLKEAP